MGENAKIAFQPKISYWNKVFVKLWFPYPNNSGKKLTLILALSAGLIFLAGCESEAQKDAIIGSAIGAALGQAIGGDTEAALIGAGVGSAAGYMLGNEADKKKTNERIETLRAEANTVTVWITNTNDSQIPVTLTKSGPNYIGPKGELYPTLPTQDQLCQVYGFQKNGCESKNFEAPVHSSPWGFFHFILSFLKASLYSILWTNQGD